MKLPSFAHCFSNLSFLLQSPWQRLVRRMTRFFTTVGTDESSAALKDTCESLALGYKLACNKQVRPRRTSASRCCSDFRLLCNPVETAPPSVRWRSAPWTDATTNSSSRFICWKWIKKCCWTFDCPRWVSTVANNSRRGLVFPILTINS